MDNKVLEAISYFSGNPYKKDEKDTLGIKIVKNKTISYAERHRGQWFRPEYDFHDIQSAQDTDSFFGRAVEIKTTKFLLAGYEFVGENPKTLEYIKKRIQQIEIASGLPFDAIMGQLAQDLFRYNNHIWIYVRDPNNSGGKSYKLGEVEYKPIAAIFSAPFETIEFKSKPNGVVDKIRQRVPGSGEMPEFAAKDIVHFWVNKRPGFTVGTPVIFSVLEDIALLRSIEENVEELIHCNLFPFFHYKIGSDKYPERVNPKTGLRETEVIAQTLEYMPSSGVYISDWRHDVQAVGSEGKALRIDFYLEYFKKRVMAGLGISPIDLGESDSSNRSTAQTASKALSESIEGLQKAIKIFLDYYFIKPLLLEGSFGSDPFSADNIVEIRFNKIDTAEQVLLENAATQLWLNDALTHDELRKRISERPLKPEQEARLKSRLFPAPVPATAGVPGAPGSTMSQNQVGIKPKSGTTVRDTRDGLLNDNLLENWLFLKSQIVPFTNGGSPGDITQKLIEGWGAEASDRLYALLKDRFNSGFSSTGRDRWEFNLDKETVILKAYASKLINNLVKSLNDKITLLHNENINVSTIFESLTWRIRLIQMDTLSKAYNYGRALGFLLDEKSSIKFSSAEESCEACKKHHGLIIDRNTFDFDLIPPSIKHGHPGCKCSLEKNE